MSTADPRTTVRRAPAALLAGRARALVPLLTQAGAALSETDPLEAARAYGWLARCHTALGQRALAAEAADRAVDRGQDAADPDAGSPAVLAFVATTWRGVGSAHTARQLAVRALTWARAAEHPATEVDALVELALAHLDGAGPAAVAPALLDEALDLARTHRLPARHWEARFARALATLVVQGPHAALPGLRRIATQAQKGSLRHVEAQALTALGRAHVELRDYDAGFTAHTAALERHRATGHRPGTAASLAGLGLCAMGTGDPAWGAQRLTQAIAMFTEVGNKAAEAAWRAHLDDALVLLQRSERRLSELERFIAVVTELGDTAWAAELHRRRGLVFLEVSDTDRALQALDQGLALARTLDDPVLQADSHAARAQVLLHLERFEQAAAALTTALDTLPADVSPAWAVEAREQLATLPPASAEGPPAGA